MDYGNLRNPSERPRHTFSENNMFSRGLSNSLKYWGLTYKKNADTTKIQQSSSTSNATIL